MAGYILVVGTYYVVMDTGVKRSVHVFLFVFFSIFFGIFGQTANTHTGLCVHIV